MMHLPAAARTALIAVVFGSLLGGCDPLAPMPPVPVSGSFQLLEINGAALPVISESTAGQLQIIEGRLQLETRGRYMQTLLVRLPGGVPADLRDSGSFRGKGTAIVFEPDERNRTGFTGTLSGDTVTIVGNPFLNSEERLVQLVYVPEER